MADQEYQFTTPVGRMIGGSIYQGKTTDSKGAPLFFKNGPRKGQPRTDFSFGVAFPKTPGVTHWASEPWLQAVWNLGHAAFPQGQAQRRDFSWKIIDGDSTEPNSVMKRPCDQEGYPGHWVIWYSSTSAPKVVNRDGSQVITDPDAVKPGYYVQVFCTVTDNKPSETAGLYWNPHYVALSAYGPEITFAPNVAAAGFGQGVQLPPGASVTPPAGIAPPGAGTPPPPPGAAPAPAHAAPPPPPPAAPAPAGLVQVPGAPHTIEQCRAGGWTDEQMISGGIATRAAAPAPTPAAPPPPPPPPAAPGAAPLPAGSVPPPPGGAQTAPAPVTANPAFTQMAAVTPPPPPPPPAAPPPAAAVRQPSAAMAAQGHTRDSLLAMPGWTEDMLVQHGHLV